MPKATHWLYCSYCKRVFRWAEFESVHRQTAECGLCGTTYDVHFGRVRAKRSRQPSFGRREFNLRLIAPNGEEELITWTAQSEDVELRARDAVAVLKYENSVISVANLTINRYFGMADAGWMPDWAMRSMFSRYSQEHAKLPWLQRLVAQSPDMRLAEAKQKLAQQQPDFTKYDDEDEDNEDDEDDGSFDSEEWEVSL